VNYDSVMQPCHDETIFAWIHDGRLPFGSRKDPGWTGNFVSNLLPQSFEAYVKILHPIDADYRGVDNPLSPNEIAILKIPPCEKLKSFVVGLREKSLGTRVRWKALAELLDVPFAPEINIEWYRAKLEDGWCWPHLLSGPDDATLGEDCLAELTSVLAQFAGDQESFFRFSRWPFAPEEKPRLFQGTLLELSPFLQAEHYQFPPEYWWPTGRAWCVCSDYDLQFTVVGGSRDLISNLLANAVLECIEVTPQTRIDNSAPLP
jgi:hypothetical protein